MFTRKLMLGALCLMTIGCSQEIDEELNPTNYEKVSNSKPELAFPDENGEIILLNRASSNPIAVSYIDNQFILSGDIILTQEQVNRLDTGNLSERAGLDDLAKRWPNGEIFYAIPDDLRGDTRVTDAIEHWDAAIPALRFVERRNEPNYIQFVVGRGCSSHLGMIGGRQFLFVASSCSTGNIIHEIGHSLGLLNEVQRTDRDNAVSIHWENVEEGQAHNLETVNTENFNTFEFGPLDFNSIMMNGSYDFSANSEPTITKLDGSTFAANRTALSNGDIETISNMYDRPDIEGVSHICNTENQTYTLDTFVPTTPIWSVSSNLQIISSNNISITVSAVDGNASEAAWVQTNMNGLTTTKEIWIGAPEIPSTLIHDAVFTCLGGEITADIQGAENYEWSVSRGKIEMGTLESSTYSGSSDTIFVNPENDPDGFTVEVRASNSCGTTSYYSKFIPTNCNDGAGGSIAL